MGIDNVVESNVAKVVVTICSLFALSGCLVAKQRKKGVPVVATFATD